MESTKIMGDRPGFEKAVHDTIKHVSFDVDSRVQVGYSN